MPGSTPRPAPQSAPSLPPPRTYSAVVQQARAALRRYREDTAAARQQLAQQQQPDGASSSTPQQPARLVLQLPLPVAWGADPSLPLLSRHYGLIDEADWPGGLPQKFRALRPLVEAVLEGYGGAFLGMLEDPADGLGAWGTAVDMTAFGIACNATFSSVAKLVAGGYGARPTQPGHTLLAANPEWTGPDDIGQFWERDLKRTAAQLLAPGSWATLYDARMVRTSRGRGHGLLVGSWSAGWHLWPAESAESSSVADECVLWSPEEPPLSDVVDALNAAAEARGAAKK